LLVECDNCVCLAIHGCFQNHFVIRIGKLRSFMILHAISSSQTCFALDLLYSLTIMDDKTAILTAITEYREAFNSGDVDRLMSVFGPNLTDMSHGVPSFYGGEGPYVLRRRITKLFEEFHCEMRISVITVEVYGDTALDFGWHMLTLTPKSGGAPSPTRQRYFEKWGRQADGSWKINFYIDNPDLVPAMPDEEFAVPYLEVVGSG
jgi:ketosteroid isomerase-like protein